MNEKMPDPAPRVRQGMDYGEHEEVQEVHAAIQREKREPRVGLEPLSMWLIVIYGLAILLGGAYVGRYSGNFNGDSLDWWILEPPRTPDDKNGPTRVADTLSPFERGKKVFAANCVVCHQASGIGSDGQGYPPLVGSEWVTGGSKRPAMIVLKGLEGPVTVKGKKYGTAVMQPWDKTLNDQKIADVLTYIRQEWGNNASPVTAEQVAALRKELAGHPGSFKEPELLAVPADEELPGGQPAAAPPGQPPQGSPAPPSPKT